MADFDIHANFGYVGSGIPISATATNCMEYFSEPHLQIAGYKSSMMYKFVFFFSELFLFDRICEFLAEADRIYGRAMVQCCVYLSVVCRRL